MTTTPRVQSGDKVRFWTPETGLQPQIGTVCSTKILHGYTYAVVQPDNEPEKRYHLFQRTVWGFEPEEGGTQP